MSTHAEQKKLTRSWIVLGAVTGILGVLAYAGAVAHLLPIPNGLQMLLGFAFGPLVTLAFIGYYHFLKLHRNSVVLQAGTVFAVIAGTLVNLMLVVQSAIFLTIPREARAELGLAFDGLNMVQLGMDVSWDIYFSLAMVLLGIAMLGHPRFGRIWGAVSILIGGGLLVLNLATFPIPPGEAESVDLGPLAGLFYLFASVRMWTSLRWVDQQLAD